MIPSKVGSRFPAKLNRPFWISSLSVRCFFGGVSLLFVVLFFVGASEKVALSKNLWKL